MDPDSERVNRKRIMPCRRACFADPSIWISCHNWDMHSHAASFACLLTRCSPQLLRPPHDFSRPLPSFAVQLFCPSPPLRSPSRDMHWRHALPVACKKGNVKSGTVLLHWLYNILLLKKYSHVVSWYGRIHTELLFWIWQIYCIYDTGFILVRYENIQ